MNGFLGLNAVLVAVLKAFGAGADPAGMEVPARAHALEVKMSLINAIVW